jgi:dephospho-CoA kinase
VIGGVASGKSSVARSLAGAEGRVLDADAEVAALYQDAAWRARLVETFGPSVLTAGQQVDRAALARVVFSDPVARRKLESLTHPEVRRRLRAALSASQAAGVARVVLDVPLLLENEAEHGLTALCDALIFVDAPLEQRDLRAVSSRGWQSGEVARREALQLPLESKRARAQHVLYNDGDPAQLERAVLSLLQKLESR